MRHLPRICALKIVKPSLEVIQGASCLRARCKNDRLSNLTLFTKFGALRGLLGMVGTAMFLLSTIAPADAESLRAVLKRTAYGNPNIRADKQRYKASKEQVTQARAGWAPQVRLQGRASLNASAQYLRPDPPGDNSPSLSSSKSVDIELVKPLYDGGTNRQRVKQAQAGVGASRQQSLGVEQQVLFQAVQAYVDVVRDRKILNQRQLNLSVLRKLADAAAKRFEVGEITRTDVSQSNARVSAAKSAVATARAQLAASEASYEEVVGSKAPKQLNWPDAARLPSSLEAALSVAQKANPNILAAAFVEDAARHNTKAIKGEADWKVDFSAVVSGNTQGQLRPQRQFSATSSASLGLVASKNLYDGGLNKSRVHEAGHIASQRSIEKIAAVRVVRQNVKTAWNNYSATVQAISSAREQVAATQSALEGVQTEYTVGSRSTVDVLNVQQELVNAQVSLIVAQHNRILTSYQLLAATGRLTARALGL
jgi:outer membrane protein